MTTSTIAPNSKIRASVLRLFERSRADSGQAFDPDRFLAFLTHPPASNGRRVADTFAGRRRFVRFMESVQLEFGVCFTDADWEAGFTFDRFIDRVATMAEKPDSARRLAAKRLAEARTSLVDAPIKCGIFTLPLLIGAIAFQHSFVRILFGVLWAAIMGSVLVLTVKNYQRTKRLLKRTDANLA